MSNAKSNFRKVKIISILNKTSIVKIFEKKLNFLTENKVYTLQARFYDNQLKLGINKEGVKEIILSMPAKIEKIKNFCNEILNNVNFTYFEN